MNKLINQLFEVLKLTSNYLILGIFADGVVDIRCGNNKTLLEVTKNKLWTPDPNILNLMLKGKSSLSDAFVDLASFKSFMGFLKKTSGDIYLNHIGFCYKVESKTKEKQRLKELVQKKDFEIYEIPSNDPSYWLFMGNISQPEKPLIEFLPVEKTDDYYVDYWLPHIHVDLDTGLPTDMIKKATHKIFKGNRCANPSSTINKVIYQTRIWLGVISGINICLDLTTNNTGSIYKRRNFLVKT